MPVAGVAIHRSRGDSERMSARDDEAEDDVRSGQRRAHVVRDRLGRGERLPRPAGRDLLPRHPVVDVHQLHAGDGAHRIEERVALRRVEGDDGERAHGSFSSTMRLR